MANIDFLPKRIRMRRRRLLRIRKRLCVLAAVMAVLTGMAYWNAARIARAQAELQDKLQRCAELKAQLDEIPALREQLREVQVKQQIVQELGSRLTTNALLAELARIMPPTTSLTSIDCSTVEERINAPAKPGAGKPAKPISEKRVRLELTGIAPSDVDVANVIGQMSACKLFRDVTMGYTRPLTIDDEQRKARAFRVSCRLAR